VERLKCDTLFSGQKSMVSAQHRPSLVGDPPFHLLFLDKTRAESPSDTGFVQNSERMNETGQYKVHLWDNFLR